MTFILVTCIGFGGIAWQNNHPANGRQLLQDTLPKEKNKTDKTVINGDLDKVIDEVNRAKENLHQQLQNKDWEKMHAQLEQSLEKLNAENVQEQLNKAMKEIDLQKIQLQAQAALKQVDWQKIQAEIQQAQQELKNNFDSKKMEIDMQRAMEQSKKAMAELKAVDMEKIQQQLEKAQQEMKLDQGRIKEDIEKARTGIKENLRRDIKKDLEKAEKEVEQAAEELHNYKDMLTEMDKDGLLDAKQPYKIAYKKGILTINGKTQPDTITNKYKHYFKKENVTIKKGKDGEDDDQTIDL